MNSNTVTRTEIVVTYHGQHGTYRHAYLSPAAAIAGIEAQTADNCAMVASVHRREPQVYTREACPELYD